MTPLQAWLARQYKYGTTTQDVAEKLGVARITVKSWSRGARFPGFAMLEPLHKMTKLSYRQLSERA